MDDFIKTKEQLIAEVEELRKRNRELGLLDCERKKTEEALSISEERFRSAFEQNPTGMVLLYPDGRLMDVNAAFCAMLGYTEDELLEKAYLNITHPDDIAASREWGGSILKGHTVPLYIEKRYLHKYGHEVWGIVSAKLLRHGDGSPRYFVVHIQDITERKKIQEELQLEKNMLELVIGAMSQTLLIIDREYNVIFQNKVAADIIGNQSGEKCFRAIEGWENVCEGCPAELTFGDGKLHTTIRTAKYPDGTTRSFENNTYPIKDSQGNIISCLEMGTEITDRLQVEEEKKRLEEQLFQSQKIESIGRLAGGIAHDFNNLLTVILGNAELSLLSIDPNDPIFKDIGEIKASAERAANLTRQLLAFSRRQIIELHITNLNDLIMDMNKMLRRLIGENIALTTVPAKNVWMVNVDPGQIEQVLINLVVNSRDAMPDGGKITIETANVILDEEYMRNHSGATPGEYVMFAVSDTGIGMDEETLTHAFEPFYTTKEKSKGTGLGLATCYGIVRQNNGYIWAYSEPGAGATIKVYLPRAGEDMIVRGTEEPVHQIEGTETVLVVEDEPQVRRIAIRALREKGYTVYEASNGEEALSIVANEALQEIHLLITDVIMPRMCGREISERLSEKFPAMKILFMSGYTDNSIVYHGILEPGLAFIQKPFTPREMAKKVRQVLDEKG